MENSVFLIALSQSPSLRTVVSTARLCLHFEVTLLSLLNDNDHQCHYTSPGW